MINLTDYISVIQTKVYLFITLIPQKCTINKPSPFIIHLSPITSLTIFNKYPTMNQYQFPPKYLMAYLWLINLLLKYTTFIFFQDTEWLQMNQVTHIINCAGKHCKNNSQLNSVDFLTYEWSENNIQNILDQNVIGASINFIE